MSCDTIHMPSELIVVVLVSGRVFPRTVCVHVHVPAKNIMDEKSGFCMGTIVGAGAGCAVETTGAAANAIANATMPSANKAECFMLLPFTRARNLRSGVVARLLACRVRA